MDETLEAFKAQVVAELQGKIFDWEATAGSVEDATLYTLGLREAIDLVRGFETEPFDTAAHPEILPLDKFLFGYSGERDGSQSVSEN